MKTYTIIISLLLALFFSCEKIQVQPKNNHLDSTNLKNLYQEDYGIRIVVDSSFSDTVVIDITEE